MLNATGCRHRWFLVVLALLAAASVAGPALAATPAGIVPPLTSSGRAARPSLATPFASTNLTYHGGPVMRTNTTYAIYWIPSGYTVSAAYTATLDGFFHNLAAASGATTNVYAADTQYSDTTGFIANTSTFAGSAIDTSPFPASGCTDPGGRPVCLTDAQLQTEIAAEMGRKGWTGGVNKLYFIFTPKNVGSCFGSSSCAYTYFCAYHSYFVHNGAVVPYANQPYAAAPGCDMGQHPNGDDADATINVASHEHNEAITDPELSAWWDGSGNEIGDKCAWNFGAALGGSSGSLYNQTINGAHYYLQQEWSNASSSCVLAMQPGAATHLLVTAAASCTAGGPVTVTVSARDDANQKVGAYRGRIHFTSSDGTATLPGDYTFTATDNGTHSFAAPVLRTVGSQTITATDTVTGSVTGSATVTVQGGTVTHFHVQGPAASVSGSAASVTVTALNAFNLQVTSYRGTIHFTSGDPLATLPGDYTFSSGDAGSHTFAAVTLRTAGGHVVSVRDTSATTATGSATIAVQAGAATHLRVSAAATTLAGGALAVTVSARDAAENVAGSYRGTVHLTSGDGDATLPADYTFTSASGGSHAFTVVLRTPGAQTVTATDAGDSSINGSANTTVQAGAVTHFRVQGPATSVSGSAASVTVTALNAANFQVDAYRGTVHLTSSDALATLPADYTFTSNDAGSHTFAAVVLRTAGGRAVAVHDTASSGVTGSATITIQPGAATHLHVASVAGTLAGASLQVTVSARDASENLATGYRGTVHLTSSDSSATLPVDYTYTAASGGSHTFAVTLRSLGSQSVTATDTVTGSISGAASATVQAGSVTHLAVTGAASGTSGTAVSLTVQALNAANYPVAGYTGTVHFATGDPLATLPADYTFTGGDAGSHTFADVTLRTAGSRTVTVTDTSLRTVAGAHSLAVAPGAVTHLGVTGAASGRTGSSVTITVTARDAANNVVGGYRGTVHFTSSDPSATLPADATFGSLNGGVRTFSVTFRTSGSQTLTATDVGAGALRGAATIGVT